MGNPQHPEDQAPAAEEEVDEVADPPQKGNDSGGSGEKPEGKYAG